MTTCIKYHKLGTVGQVIVLAFQNICLFKIILTNKKVIIEIVVLPHPKFPENSIFCLSTIILKHVLSFNALFVNDLINYISLLVFKTPMLFNFVILILKIKINQDFGNFIFFQFSSVSVMQKIN